MHRHAWAALLAALAAQAATHARGTPRSACREVRDTTGIAQAYGDVRGDMQATRYKRTLWTGPRLRARPLHALSSRRVL
jgi:hypothetical protein